MVMVPPLLGSSRSPVANVAAPRFALDEPALPAPEVLAPPAGLAPPVFDMPPLEVPELPVFDAPPVELPVPPEVVAAPAPLVALAPPMLPAGESEEAGFEEQPKTAVNKPTARLRDWRVDKLPLMHTQCPDESSLPEQSRDFAQMK